MICPTECLWVTYVAIAIHILLMMLVNAVLSKCGKSNDKDAAECSFWDFLFSLKDQFLAALTNIYLPWSDGLDEQHDVKRHIIVEIIILAENLAVSIWAASSPLDQMLEQHKVKYLQVIWSCYACYFCIKCSFFLFMHPWADLIKKRLTDSMNCSKCCDDKKALDTEGRFFSVTYSEVPNKQAGIKKPKQGGSFSLLHEQGGKKSEKS